LRACFLLKDCRSKYLDLKRSTLLYISFVDQLDIGTFEKDVSFTSSRKLTQSGFKDKSSNKAAIDNEQ